MRLILGSAAVGVVIALGMRGILELLNFDLDAAIIGAIAGVGAGIYASSVRMRRQRGA